MDDAEMRRFSASNSLMLKSKQFKKHKPERVRRSTSTPQRAKAMDDVEMRRFSASSRREINRKGILQNPFRPSLLLRQKPSKVFDGRVRPFPSAEILANSFAISLTLPELPQTSFVYTV
jgi:hypothetical protein